MRFSFGRLEEAARCGLPRHTNSECLYCTTADTGSIGCVNDHQLAGILGVSHRQIYRYRKENLSVDVADRLAVVLGHHPSEIWDEWCDVEWTDDEEEVA